MAELNDETIISVLQEKENIDTLDKSSSSSSSLEKSPVKPDNPKSNLSLDDDSLSDDEAVRSFRRRAKRFSDSDSDVEADKENKEKVNLPKKASKPNSSSESEDDVFPRKSRLIANDSSDDDTTTSKEDSSSKTDKRNNMSDSVEDNLKNKLMCEKTSKPNSSSDSEGDIFPRKSRLITNSKDSSDDSVTSPKNESARISDKRSKLHNKFKGLLNSRSKLPEYQGISLLKSSDENNGSNSDDSGSGIESIKQKIKQKSMLLKSGICDPDTSSDEERSPKQKQRKKKVNQKSTIMISPKKMEKPARMSAKQAMENMQKIKSESNRMLREKEVSLPYHRPKALSLKDIMNRRRPALSADGKALPVKMNSDQLKQYVKLLEQRNKEMMELCKSESEEEEEETNDTPTDTNKESGSQSSAQEVTDNNTAQNEEKTDENVVIPINLAEDSNEIDLPDLIVESVQKEPNPLHIDVSERDTLNTDVTEKNVINTDTAEKDGSNMVDKELSTTDTGTKDESITDIAEKNVSANDIADKNMSSTEIAEKEAENTDITRKDDDVHIKKSSEENVTEPGTNIKLATEIESQLMELRYDTEKMQNTEDLDNAQTENTSKNATTVSDTDIIMEENEKEIEFDDDFDDVDINMEDLDSIIENAKDNVSAVDSPMLIRDTFNLNKKPKLTGAPGMLIDLDGSNPVGPRKLTGVELLKERFTYFAKLKTPEEKERERELTVKPGMQHFKLKQELEEKIADQRSLEWAKRLEEEKQQHEEMDAIRGDDSDVDDLEKIEAKLQEKENVVKESSSEEEEEPEEDDCDMTDKPRKKNPMVDDEAEVSDDEGLGEQDNKVLNDGEEYDDATNDADNEDDDDESESSDESSDDEEENQSMPKKGRILKAFEDSDEESTNVKDNPGAVIVSDAANDVSKTPTDSQIDKDSQDDLIPLAQTNKSFSEDLFGSQTSCNPSNASQDTKKTSDEDLADMTTQTFSILNTNASEINTTDNVSNAPSSIDVICETQPADEASLDDVVGMCSGKFTQTQNIIPAESQISESQCPIGEDILALCTGQFYDNQFVTQEDSPENDLTTPKVAAPEKIPTAKKEEKDLLDSILKEMDEPVEDPSRKKIVFDNATENEAVSFDPLNHVRKKFVIDSDDESNVDSNAVKKKKLKKRKLGQRALQISDDEEDEELLQSDEEGEEDMSEVEEDNGVERVVEYDSEENEVEVKPQKQKKNRKMAEFFEQEAELTSEDEWVGSGDEDERGLDRMEREEGDDDTFHQGQLQRELGQIHMRDVLDQDKREVRLIQELLFEDGDLGDGGRQRKFRWKNLDGEDVPGSVPELFADSQEQEFESEEQWRKQRHEREVFLRSLKEKESDEHNISIDRSTIIKANLCSRTMSSLLMEANGAQARVEATTVVVEKKIEREEPARNPPLRVFQQSYHGSLLTRGRGALARLAALALPLAGEADDEAKPTVGPSSKRNFVFTALTPPAKEAKAPKRKADNNVNIGTPRLIKKFKTDDKPKFPKASLLDHLKAL